MAVAFHSDSIEIQEEDDDDDGDNQTPEDNVQYENVETKTSAQKNPQKKSGRCKLVVLGFGLLCGVQALLNIGLRMSLYSEPINNLTNLTKHLDHLQSRYNTLTKDLAIITAERDELKRKRCKSGGWQTFGSSCYYISTEEKTWLQSRKYCTETASDLIVINSQEEQDFVNRNMNNQEVWLGLTDRVVEGVWKWVDDKPLTSPTYWNKPHEPNNAGEGEDCAVFNNGGWDDRPSPMGYGNAFSIVF